MIEGFEFHKKAQLIARETINILQDFIVVGMTEREIKEEAERIMQSKGIKSFWYYGVGAFVLVGDRTTLSISGRDYRVTDTCVKENDLSPEVNGYWGDFARSFVVENGQCVDISKTAFQEEIDMEKKLHKIFQEIVFPSMTFEKVYKEMNRIIVELGYENLDFNNNLGHSIVQNKDNRVYIEEGNDICLKDVNMFTFEPHIRKKNDGEYGFKHENIYYFEDGVMKVL